MVDITKITDGIKTARPYGTWMFTWLWFDVVFYFPQPVGCQESAIEAEGWS